MLTSCGRNDSKTDSTAQNILEELILIHLVRNSLHFIDLKESSPFSQKPHQTF